MFVTEKTIVMDAVQQIKCSSTNFNCHLNITVVVSIVFIQKKPKKKTKTSASLLKLFDSKPPAVLCIYMLSWFADLHGKHKEIIGGRQLKVTLVTHTEATQYTLQEPQAGAPQAVVALWPVVTYKSQRLLSVSLLLIEF